MLHENKEFKQPKLVHLDLETSSYCNFNCNFCPRPKENGIMPLEDIKRIIKEFADQGGETIKPFWRGEPFADKRMPEILRAIQGNGLKSMINSNASDPLNILDDCLPYIDWISFSIDEQHGNIDNKTFDNLIKAYWFMRKHNKYIEVQASKKNKFVASACEMDYAADYIPYKVDPPTKRSDKDTTSEVITGERKYCGFPSWRLVVAYNGDCTLCCVDWELENKIGNIYENSLKEIFYGDKAGELRKVLKNNKRLYMSDICDYCPSRSAYQ